MEQTEKQVNQVRLTFQSVAPSPTRASPEISVASLCHSPRNYNKSSNSGGGPRPSSSSVGGSRPSSSWGGAPGPSSSYNSGDSRPSSVDSSELSVLEEIEPGFFLSDDELDLGKK